MKFSFAEWKNFKSYGDYTTRIDFNFQETLLFLGENGAGKTTFIDAILWCLYGKSLDNVDGIVNRETGKDCKVEVNFDIGEDNYSIIRYRNHSVHQNKVLVFKNKENISPRTVNDAQKMIDDIIQIQYNAMTSSVIFSSELYISFLRSKPSDRLKILESILSLKEIQDWQQEVDKLRKPIEDILTSLNLDNSKFSVEEITLTDSLNTFKEKIKNALIGLKNNKERLEEERKIIDIDLVKLHEINVEEEIRKNSESEIALKNNNDITSRIKILEAKLVDIQDLVSDLELVKNKISDLELVLNSAKVEDLEENENNKRFNLELDNKYKLVLKDCKQAESKEEEILNATLKLNKEIDEIKNNIKICPLCKQPVAKEFNDTIIEGKLYELDSLNNERDTLHAKVEKFNEVLGEIKNRYKPVKTFDISINDRHEKEKALVSLKEQVRSQEANISTSEERNKEFNKEIKDLKEKLIPVVNPSIYSLDYLLNLKENIENKNKRIIDIGNEVNVINEKAKTLYDKKYIEELQGKINEARKQIGLVTGKIKEQNFEEKHYTFLYDLFSNKDIGIKKYIINKMLDTFNEKINFYLPLFFTEPIKITFDKSLDEIIEFDGKKVSFHSFSSGEKTRLELSIAFSLFMLVKVFFSTETNILIFDEVLDKNLDEKGVRGVLDIIETLSVDNSIIVISHRNEYKDSFSNSLLIEKDSEGFSHIA